MHGTVEGTVGASRHNRVECVYVCVCVKSKRSNFVIREFEDERSHTTKETLGNASGSPTDETHTTR